MDFELTFVRWACVHYKFLFLFRAPCGSPHPLIEWTLLLTFFSSLPVSYFLNCADAPRMDADGLDPLDAELSPGLISQAMEVDMRNRRTATAAKVAGLGDEAPGASKHDVTGFVTT
jgi:hypothetical protein